MGKKARLKRTLRREIRRVLATAGVDDQEPEQSPQAASAGLLWAEPRVGRAAAVATLERHDNFSGVRNALRHVATEKDEWAGIPVPIDGERLVIEPSYKFAGLANVGRDADCTEDVTDDGRRIRNVFWSTKFRCRVAVYGDVDGKVRMQPMIGTGNQATMMISTIGASFAWGIEQESNAVQLLATMVGHIAFKQYMLTGSFLETSRRSRITYVFRRLRPTVAIKEKRGRMCILAAMCMHPIGYYAGTWGGAMCPTDDVIAHLALMRGDEPMFWRRCNQHPPHAQESGL